MITFIALAVAIPIGVGNAVYLSEYASNSVRQYLKPALEVLAGIPTVVYGFFAAITVAPAIVEIAEVIGVEAAYNSALASGVVMGKFLNSVSKQPINPLIGAAGVSAVPMAARVANKVGVEANPQNILLMHAMGPNVAGVIGSAIAAGVMIMLTS